VYIPVGWCGRDAAEPDRLNQKGIGGTKDRPDVVQAAHVVQNNEERRLAGGFELLYALSVQFVVGQLPHSEKFQLN